MYSTTVQQLLDEKKQQRRFAHVLIVKDHPDLLHIARLWRDYPVLLRVSDNDNIRSLHELWNFCEYDQLQLLEQIGQEFTTFWPRFQALKFFGLIFPDGTIHSNLAALLDNQKQTKSGGSGE